VVPIGTGFGATPQTVPMTAERLPQAGS
jgi:hypothetical protein